MSSPAPGSQVLELVRALALGWKNLSAYPPGHPALVGSVDLIQKKLNELRGPGGDVVLGIARDGLLYGQQKIDSTQAQKFAQALYTRGVALIRFEPAAESSDIEKFLRLLGAGTPGETRRPLWEELTAAGVLNIYLQPVDYSAVQVTDDLTAAPPPPPPRKLSSSLWENILQAMIAGRELTPEGRQLLTREVHSINDLTVLVGDFMKEAGLSEKSIDSHATFGVNLTRVPGSADTPEAIAARVAETVSLHVAASTGLRKQLAVQQVMQLLRSLPDPMRGAVLRSVSRVLATDPSAASLLRDLTSSLPKDEVLETFRFLATVPNLSSHTVMLMESLVSTEKPGAAAPQPVSPAAVGDVVRLFADEDVDRFNPEDHRVLLSQVSVQIPEARGSPQASLEQLGDRVDTLTDVAVTRQLSRTLLELAERYGSSRQPTAILQRVEVLFRTQLSTTHFDDAGEILERLQAMSQGTENSPELRAAVAESLGRLARGETIQTLLETVHSASPQNTPAIQRLIELLGAAAARSLLMALAEESNRSRRRRLLGFLTNLGAVIVPEATKFLADSRWYVVRNMIILLRTVNDRTSLPEIRRSARHPDLRVRLEAIKSLLAFESTVPQALLEEAINDPDPKLAEAAIGLVGNYGIKEAVDPLLAILKSFDFFGSKRSLRLKALKALGELAEPAALSRLEPFFTDPFLPWPNKEERRAAFESLATYPFEARTPIVEKGLRSRDPQIRAICSRLSATTQRGSRETGT